MDTLQAWTVRHPVAFLVSFAATAIILGWAVNGDGFFWASAALSAIGWLSLAEERFPELRKTPSRKGLSGVRSTPRAAILPPLPLPAERHVLLPSGQKIQVTKEEDHLPSLVALLAGNEERHMAATLHALAPESQRSTRERVQVRIDDVTVGELTTYMSEHFLPVIHVCHKRGIAVVCRAIVKGNQLKVDVVLDTVRAIDLGDRWINEHVLGTETL
ncbi:hypothetical protein [Tessaracoccus sp.]